MRSPWLSCLLLWCYVLCVDTTVASSSSPIYRIHPLRDLEVTSTATGQPNTSLRCQLETSRDFRLQSVTWSKISRHDGQVRREFVYHYDRCSGEDVAYGSLAGRAGVTVTSYNGSDHLQVSYAMFTPATPTQLYCRIVAWAS